MDYLKWVMEWFQKNSGADTMGIEGKLDENYFDIGYIDSFGFIMLITAIEEDFNVSFDNEKFQDRSFSTIRGLAKAIEHEVVKNEN